MEWLVPIALFVAVAGFLILARYAKWSYALWQEPVFKCPVVIFESDDWGPAEAFEAQRLQQIADVLGRYRDGHGRHPVMTLGVVLSVPDTVKIRENAASRYHARRLDQPEFQAIRDAMQGGVSRRVFAIQLHGMAHYQPQVLLKAASLDPEVKAWLSRDGVADPWELPSPLQSRWIDGSRLPSRPLDSKQIEQWAGEEAGVFREIFAAEPEVAVPPTFVWTSAVEQAWSQNGVKYIVTPGKRYNGRDNQGQPVPVGAVIRNGQQGKAERVRYLVRNDYFEPDYGHQAEDALQALRKKWALGRPTLYETHRFNFIGPKKAFKSALEELERALQLIISDYPGVRFVSTAELGQIIEKNDPEWIEQRIGARLHYLQRRACREIPVIRRLCSGQAELTSRAP